MQYPAQRFVIQPSGRIKEVTITGQIVMGEWYPSETGKYYLAEQLFRTRAEAIAAGKSQIDAAREKLCKSMDKLDKKVAQLQREVLK